MVCEQRYLRIEIDLGVGLGMLWMEICRGVVQVMLRGDILVHLVSVVVVQMEHRATER